MKYGRNEEALFWKRLDAFSKISENLLSTGAPLEDAEELLFGWMLPGTLPAVYAGLTGGLAHSAALLED